MVALACGHQDRRGEAAGKTDEGHGQRVLHQRDHRSESADQAERDEGRAGGQELVQPEGSEHREVKHRHPGALQGERIGQLARRPHPQPEASDEQADAGRADRGQPQLRREH
ncbi:MAG: hypothetical protein ABI919_07675 [Ramlibacter sp.]